MARAQCRWGRLIVGVTPEQVSRWENDGNPPEKSAGKLIRLCYCLLSVTESCRAGKLENWLMAIPGPEQTENVQATLSRKSHEWKAEAEPVIRLFCFSVRSSQHNLQE